MIKKNNYYISKNIDILKKIESESCQMVYLDPPYNTGRNFDDFMDKFETNEIYQKFLTEIFFEIKRILKKDGVIIVHVEAKVGHFIRFGLDDVFGGKNFQNEIIWKSGGNSKTLKKLQRNHDSIFVYSKTKKYKFNPIYLDYDEDYRNKNTIYLDERGEYITSAAHNSQPNVNPRPNLRYVFNGQQKQWYTEEKRMLLLEQENRLYYSKNSDVPRFKKYLHEMDGIPIRDIWVDIKQIQSNEKLDYATQKPVKLLERIISLYSDENDLVLDPFAGSGTLGRASISLNRNYILIDINKKAKEIFLNSL